MLTIREVLIKYLMLIPLNATRMELLRLKRRLALAKRGHKLLKDKQEELMRHILLLTRKVREKRKEVAEKLSEAIKRFHIARLYENPQFFATAVCEPSFAVAVKTTQKRILSLIIPEMAVTLKELGRRYGLFQTSGELEEGIERFKKILPILIELAAEERALEILLREFERTKRRVNALEYVLIPSLESGVKEIRLKLSETERQDLIRLQRVKR